MKVITTDRLVIKSWCNNPEQGAIDQATNCANLPFAFKHIALMPDTHQGYGVPIGGVIATKGVIMPSAVGVDIGCGMRAVKTSLKEVSSDGIKTIFRIIREQVPLGFNRRLEPLDMPPLDENSNESMMPIVFREYEKARYQVGTLGGGNHFIEIQKGSDGYIWFMIHSGSRNLGKQVCDYYTNIAKEQNARWFSQVDIKHDLAFLPVDTDEGKAYIAEMNYCLDFAKLNRQVMAREIQDAFSRCYGENFEAIESYDVHHNYARLENHFGKNVWVHRKGATSARLDEIGIIPGSQGTKSYIVKGLGNRESFTSCSHGAGRVLGRKEAQRTLSLEEEIRKMDEKGIVHGIQNVDDLDEAASAYKDIDIVMDEQKDLVKILVELSPLGVIKS